MKNTLVFYLIEFLIAHHKIDNKFHYHYEKLMHKYLYQLENLKIYFCIVLALAGDSTITRSDITLSFSTVCFDCSVTDLKQIQISGHLFAIIYSIIDLF